MEENELKFLQELRNLLRKYDASIHFNCGEMEDYMFINIGDGGVCYHNQEGLCEIYGGLNADNIMNFDKDESI